MSEPRKILWSERDTGEKLSIVMGAIIYIGFAGFAAFMGVKAALDGEWWQLVGAIGLIVVSVEIWFGWKRRNAR